VTQSQSGRGREEKNSQPLPGLEPPLILITFYYNFGNVLQKQVADLVSKVSGRTCEAGDRKRGTC
jgi:hypothetical protein